MGDVVCVDKIHEMQGSSIISKPGYERQLARPMFQSIANYISFSYASRLSKIISERAVRIEIGVEILKIRDIY